MWKNLLPAVYILMSQLSGKTIFIAVGVIAAVYFIFRTDGKEGFRKLNTKRSCPDLLVQKGPKIYLYNTKLAEVPGVNPIMFNNLEEYTEFLDWQKSQGIRCPVLYLQEVYDASGKVICKTRPCVTEPQGGLPPNNATLDAKGTNFSNIPDIDGTTSVNGVANTNNDENGSVNGVSNSGTTKTSSRYLVDHDNRYPNLERVKLLDSNVDDPPYNIGGYPAHDPTSFYHGVHTPLDELDVVIEKSEISPNPMDPNWGGDGYTNSLIQGDYYKENEILHYS